MISDKAKGMTSQDKIYSDLKKWKDSEALFMELLPCLKASSEADNMNHSDFEFDEIAGMNVDVKGLKDSHKNGYVLLELVNVAGKTGWMSSDSLAKYFAFQFPEAFYIFPKSDMLYFLKERMPPYSAPNRNPSRGKRDYKKLSYTYQGRPNRKDVFTYVPIKDLKENVPYITYQY